MKRTAIAVLTLTLAGQSAGAVERYDMSKMTCQQVKQGLEQNRKALFRNMSKKVPGMMLYNTYVGSRSMCTGGQAPTNKTIKVKDGACPVVQCVTPGHAWYRP